MQSDHLTPSGARHEHRVTARHRAQLAVWSGVIVIVVALGALIATDTVRFPRPTGPRLSGDASALTANGRIVDTPVAAPRPLTPDQPLRLWIAGDSLAGSLGPSLGDLTAATGVVQPVYDSRVSSGLTTPSFFDWPKHAAREITRLQPEAVVFMIGTNDANIASDSPEWRDDYKRRVENMLAILVGAQPRAVYWIGAPIMKDDGLSRRVREVNAVAREVIAEHSEITYFDSYSLFANPDGTYASSFSDATGNRTFVRADDGVHFTPEGGDRLGSAVFKLLDARWNLLRQAVPGAAKQVTETKGSTKLPGTSRTPRSGRQNNGTTRTTSGTTTTTSAVPETTPPSSTTSTTSAPTTSSSPSSTSPTTSSTPSLTS
jgi:hypothetical protein